jgi:hypothetical protein
MRTFLVAALAVALVAPARADSDPPAPDVPDTTPTPAVDDTPPAPTAAPVAPIAPPAMTPLATTAPVMPEAPADRTAAYIATGVTGAALLGAVVCLIKFNQASDDAGNSKPGQLGTDAEAKLRAAYDEADSWRTRGFVMGGVVLVGAVVSGYLWGETAPKRPALGVHPTPDGAAVSLSGRF